MTTETKFLPVAAIENGTVIDHIPAGNGIQIVDLLKLPSHKKQVTLGLNLPSRSFGLKDIIKVEQRALTAQEASQVAIFAPHATISLIRNYEIEEKYQVTMPETIEKVFSCPNPNCISNHENIPSCLMVEKKVEPHIRLECRYCRKIFTHEEIETP